MAPIASDPVPKTIAAVVPADCHRHIVTNAAGFLGTKFDAYAAHRLNR
jgi:hypothetical protein